MMTTLKADDFKEGEREGGREGDNTLSKARLEICLEMLSVIQEAEFAIPPTV